VTRPRLDVQALYDALDQQRRSKKLSWRQLAGEAGVSPSTLSRMTQGKRPDVDSLAPPPEPFFVAHPARRS